MFQLIWIICKKKKKDLDVGKLKTVSVDLKKFSDVVDNEVVESTKFNILKTEVNKLYKKIFNATTLIHINQYKTVIQNFENIFEDVDNKRGDVSGLVTASVLNTKIKEIDNKIPDLNGLVKKTYYDAKISEIEGK